jgi:RNA recognition motif-containing protein
VAPSARIFVGNVPFATTQEEFARVFEDAGVGARRAALAVDASGQSRGYGLVRFKNAEAAEKALAALEGLEIGGRPARCKVDERPDDDAARAAAAAAAAKARLDGSPS